MGKKKKTASIDDLKNKYEKELQTNQIQEIKIELSIFERIFNIGAVRKALIIIALALIWQFYAVYLDNELMLPTFLATAKGFLSVILNGELVEKTVTSLKVLFSAYACGVLLAGTLTVLAITTRVGTDFLEVLTAMFNPLPAIALLPLALLWFGLGYPSIIFVIIHAVTWPIALNIYNGFMSVSNTLRMVGKNYELTGLSFVFKILIPAAFASILTGLKVGWAFSWRTLIAAELVFGVSSGGGGLGWFIYEKKNQLDIDLVFAGLLTVIIIGILIENIVFKTIERKTVIKWGMKF
ncbi:MAG: ABC transporter permease subunit [Campylobacteraceae bacterium]|jgi:NitT/TauT family transport system permease protein|nr:ABC transporter permease subunit [Campylobacteraceae bacterium]